MLLVRDPPLHEGHLELVLKVIRIGGIIMPPIPAFHHLPETIMDIVDQTIGKALNLFSIDAKLFNRWGTDARLFLTLCRKNRRER